MYYIVNKYIFIFSIYNVIVNNIPVFYSQCKQLVCASYSCFQRVLLKRNADHRITHNSETDNSILKGESFKW